MDVFGPGHEQVVFCADPASGLRAIIAIHSTTLGPALGGTRFHPDPDEEAALADVLNLSRAMTYKNALAGLDHGGGKAVILGDPSQDKSEASLRAYGRFVDALAGRYITACDVGTTVADMDVVARETRFATGRSLDHGGAGDSGILTAFGVFQGMRACCAHRFGSASLAGRRVGVVGVGKVGRRLVEHCLDDGAEVLVTDPDALAVDRLREAHPEVTVVGSAADLVEAGLDVYSPNAMGGAIDAGVAATLTAAIVCGGANNQLAEAGLADVLADRKVLYAPDYLVNAGGVIQVADELQGFSPERARAATARIFDTTLAVLEQAASTGTTPAAAADRLAEQRIASIGRFRGAIGLPGH
ncbi:MAG: Glu/Leu/Phe/Val dehydrogenase dimerization domain-containing protein [Actinomycetes bacterium]